MTPRVSIVMPVYNGARFIGAAIESVLSQDFQDWELIVVDDGSTDETADIVTRCGDARVQYIYQRNQGPSAARNAGIYRARGEFLAFLDADDEWEPEFLGRCVKVLSGNGRLVAVYSRYYYIDEGGRRLSSALGEVVAPDQLPTRLVETNVFPLHAGLARADAVRAVGVFDTGLTGIEDWDLWLRIARTGAIQGIAEPLARYRVYPGTWSSSNERMLNNRMKLLAKHFGAPDGDFHDWPVDKRRAYGCAYRGDAVMLIQEGRAEEGLRRLDRAVEVWPGLLRDLDTFYELACWNQPREVRGKASLLDLKASEQRVLAWVEALSRLGNADVRALQREAAGNAHLALAMLNDQAGRWGEAARHMGQALRMRPSLALSPSFVRRGIKVSVRSLGIGGPKRP